MASIDETALKLRQVDWLRGMAGEEAAAFWLRPLHCDCGGF